MSKKHSKTYDSLCKHPVPSGIKWNDIESLFIYLGAEISEGRGSRVRVILNGAKAVFHRPHPHKETDKGAVKSVIKFLNQAGIYDL